MIVNERIGHVDQVALVTGRPAIDIRAYRGIDVRLHADRGLDIGASRFWGFPLAWISSVGEGGAPADEWREAWGGGLLTACELDNVALGIEPANCSVLGRAHDRAEGRLPMLDPGAERTTRVVIRAEPI